MPPQKNPITIAKVLGILTIATCVISVFNWMSDMKTDVALIKQKIFYEHSGLDIRISALERTYDEKKPKQLVFNQPTAILPNSSTNIKEDK